MVTLMKHEILAESPKDLSPWARWIWISVHLLTKETDREYYPTNCDVLKTLKRSGHRPE